MAAPTFEVRLWCNQCSKIVGTIPAVRRNDPDDRVNLAMIAHAEEKHARAVPR